MGNTPKKSHTGLIIGIIAGVVVIATILIVVFAVILPNANKSKDGDKKDDNTSKNSDKDKNKENGGNNNNGNNDEGGSTTTSKKITVTFNGTSIEVGRYFGENARAVAKIGTLYTEDGEFDEKKLTDLDGYLNKTYTFDMDADFDEKDRLPYVEYKFDESDWDTAVINVRGFYSSMGSGKKTVKNSDLESYVAFWCGKNEKITIGGKSLECNKSKGSDVAAAFPNAKENYGNYSIELNNYQIDFMFNSYEGDVLSEIMVQYWGF